MRTLTVTAVLAVAATALTGCGNLSFGTHEENRSYTAPAGVTALKIKSGGSRVEVTASDSPGIRVGERLRWSNDHNKPKIRHVTEGDTLTLSSECAEATMGVTACGVSYRVQVPRTVPVEIDNSDGTIVASGLGGTVKLHTDNGSIEVSDMRASSASISSSDGSIRVSGRATTADLSSDNGSIDGGGLAAERLTAVTSNGSIVLGFTAAPTDVQVRSDNGSIRVGVPSGQSYAVSASTDNGGKRIDPAVHQDSASPRRIRLDTANGSVTVTAGDQRSW